MRHRSQMPYSSLILYLLIVCQSLGLYRLSLDYDEHCESDVCVSLPHEKAPDGEHPIGGIWRLFDMRRLHYLSLAVVTLAA
jgi:hypothetical protein